MTLALLPDWVDDAVCTRAEPELFFPEKGGTTRPALALCAECPVQPECLDYAITNNIHHGVWGGMSERARARLRQRNAA